jgi:hypothetical protein
MFKNLGVKFGIAGLLAGLAGSASAALPTEATAAFTSITTAVTDVESGVWPVIAIAIVAGITIKLVKRFSSKI